jgi:hypothetical protein
MNTTVSDTRREPGDLSDPSSITAVAPRRQGSRPAVPDAPAVPDVPDGRAAACRHGLEAVEDGARRAVPPVWWRRIAAGAVDLLVLVLVYAVAALSLSAAFSRREEVDGILQSRVSHAGDVVLLGVLLVWWIGYFTIAHGSSEGRSVGERLSGVAVRDARAGGPIGYRRALVRTLTRLGLYAALVFPGLLDSLRPLLAPGTVSLPDRVAAAAVCRT